jgi:hypothetical protein
MRLQNFGGWPVSAFVLRLFQGFHAGLAVALEGLQSLAFLGLDGR